MKTKIQLFVGVFAFLLLCPLSFAQQSGQYFSLSGLDDLNPQDQNKVKDGSPVFRFEPDQPEDNPWPRLIYFQIVKATPEEASAVFHDYARNKEYYPNMVKSVVTTPDFTHQKKVQIDYAITVGQLPFWPYTDLGNENYTTEDLVDTYPSDFGKSYQFDWKQVKADSMLDMKGKVTFEPLNDGSTLMHYESSCYPGHWASSFEVVIDQYKGMVSTAVGKFVERVIQFKTTQDPILQSEIDLLRSSLGES